MSQAGVKTDWQSVVGRWRDISAAHPTRLAVADGLVEWSYRDLERRVHGWIAELMKWPQVENVALHLAHGAEGIAALLGVLASGRSYLVLDPSQPVAARVVVVFGIGAALSAAMSRPSRCSGPTAKPIAARRATISACSGRRSVAWG